MIERPVDVGPLRRSRNGVILTPLFAVSVATLLVNDHVLKAAWPGWVTGKLSDVAGVAMVVLGLTALLRSRSVAFGLTTVGFAALKTIAAVAVWAAPVLGGVTRTDPTDLLALLILVPLWEWTGNRMAPGVTPRTDAHARSRWLVVGHVAAVGVAVVAATGSSCGESGLYDVRAIDGTLYARSDADVWTSDDGGRSWQASDLTAFDDRFQAPQPQPACVDHRCFEITRSPSGNGFTVTESGEGAPQEVLAVSSAQQLEFQRAIRPSCGDSSGADVAAVEQSDGVHLVVGMGEAGVLHRGPDETWEWVAVGSWGVSRGEESGDTFLGHQIGSRPPQSFVASSWIARALLLAAPILAFGSAAPMAALARRRGRHAVAAVALSVLLGLIVVAPTLVLLSLLPGASERNVGQYAIAGGVLTCLAAVGVGSLAVWFGRDARPARPDPGWTSVAPPWPAPSSALPPSGPDEPME